MDIRARNEKEKSKFFSLLINTHTQQQQKKKERINVFMRDRETSEKKSNVIGLYMFWFDIIIIRCRGFRIR